MKHFLTLSLHKWAIKTADVILIVALLFPIAYLVITAGIDLGSPLHSALGSAQWQTYSVNTLLLIIITSVFSLMFGLPTAWITAKYKFYGSRWFKWLLMLPLAIPTYIAAIAYIGFFRLFTINPFGFANVFTLGFVLAAVLYPYIYIVCRSVFEVQSARYIEAAQLLGSSGMSIFTKIALPLARPALVGSLFLVLMELLNDYGAAKYFGVSTFTTGIFQTWFSYGNLAGAIRLAVILLLFVIALMLLERWLRRNKLFTGVSVKNHKASSQTLKGAQSAMAAVVCFIPLVAGFIIPLSQLLKWASKGTYVFSDYRFWKLVSNSLSVAFIAAFLCGLIALIVAGLNFWQSNKLSSNLRKLSTVGYAIPGAIIALAVSVPAYKFDSIVGHALVGGTLSVLFYAYVIRFMAVAFSPIESALQQIPKSISEASLLLGKSKFQTFYKINIPLITKGILAAIIIAFIDVLKELPLTLIARPFNFDTLATKTFEWAGDEQLYEAAIPALFILLLGLIPAIGLNWLMEKR